MTLDRALKQNPFDPDRGNLSAYIRYLRYNVDGWYNKTSQEVRQILQERTPKERGGEK